MNEPNGFPSTHWTCIQRIASNNALEARRAMEEVCQIYWRPLHQYALSINASHEDAEDCVQGFLAKVSTEDFFSSVAPHKGKLRSFLLVSFKRFIYDVWKRQLSQKRGGGLQDIPLGDLQIPDNNESEITTYDQEWAKIVVDDARARLRKRYNSQGNEELLDAISPALDGTPLSNSAEICKNFELSDVAYKSAIHRVRRRFGEEIKAVVGETVLDQNDIDDEIRWLMKALEV